MKKAWVQWGGAASVACLVLLLGVPLHAADQSGVRLVADELGQRTKEPADAEGAPQDKLSDSAVRVMSTLAWSIMPEKYTTLNGKTVKLDKKNPNKYFIPFDDARRIIRTATRSAYAEACELFDLERANYEALMRGEEARKVWSQDQMIFINALHMFSVSYFTGNMKVTATEEEDKVEGAETAADAAAKAKAAGGNPAKDDAAPQKQGTDKGATAQVITPKKLECTPEQKEKVASAINAYVKAAKASLPAATATPPAASAQPDATAQQPDATAKPAPAPVAGGAN